MHRVSFQPTFEDWQRAARDLLGQEVAPNEIFWQEAGEGQPALELFEDHQAIAAPPAKFRVPKAFLEVARTASLHSKEGKWALLYRVLWRLTHAEPKLLEIPVDADIIELTHLGKEVSKDAYRMRAFLRFRETEIEGESWFVAWYEPEHNTVHLNETFFVDRFANLRWSILTPKRCMHWDGVSVSFSPGVDKSLAPTNDDVEPLWVAYYSNIFNPARLKPKAMQAQLVKRNWKNLPEAVVIEPLLRSAPRRSSMMLAQSDFQRVRETDFSSAQIPEQRDFASLRQAAANCRACPLWKNASCTVFGDGPINAKVVFVGEQPGDQEDRAGQPFIGPAGQIFNRALETAGLDRAEVYVTNAVKHFKFEPRGKRRIHKTANAREIAACRPWLDAELDLIKPKLIVALGRTAAHSLFGSPIKILQQRGTFMQSPNGLETLITVHPSSLLRLPVNVNFDEQFELCVADLRKIKTVIT